MLTYAIGDIHGMYNSMIRALNYIDSDCGDSPKKIIFLGDYTDRGPDSKKVIEKLMELSCDPQYIMIQGNHDQMMYETILNNNYEHERIWLRNGGWKTLDNYKIDGKDSRRFRNNHNIGLLRKHSKFLKSLPLFYEDDVRIFVHAGLLPGVNLHNQTKHDLLWIRNEFLASKYDFGKIVVHGHTPFYNPQIKSNRISIDTGCCFPGGYLTIAKFVDDSIVPEFKFIKEEKN